MTLKRTPRTPSGYTPGMEFEDKGNPYGIKVGIVIRVDEVELTCDIKILSGGERFEVELTQAQSGPRSFWGGIPEVNSLVLIGYRRKHKQSYEAVILGYIPNGKKSGLRFDPVSPADPSAILPNDAEDFKRLFGGTVRYKRLKLAPGDVGGMSSAGSEFTLSKDIRMLNRAGDLLELRDEERTYVRQSVHKVESEAGVFRVSGPARRSAMFLPSDIFADGKFKTKDARYYGGTAIKRLTTDGVTPLDLVNDTEAFPPITLANGKQIFYPVTFPAVSLETEDGAGAEVYTEDRIELTHTTDLVPEVREEIDGFQIDRRPIFIERVLGTLVGADSSSDTGLQQYGQVLRPKIFDDFQSTGPATFTTEPVARSSLDDSEVYTTAGAVLLRVLPPSNAAGRPDTITSFAAAVSKQGKLFLQVPGSKIDNYSSGTKNVSAEVNMGGALKMRLGAAKPDNISLHLTMEGGAVFDFRGSSSGAGLRFKTHSSYVVEAQGVPDNENLAYSEQLQGNRESFTSADSTEQVEGSKISNISGAYQILADRLSINAPTGMGVNVGNFDFLSSGKSQYRYAQDVVETVVTGGKATTILLGNLSETLLLGDRTTNITAGSQKSTITAGNYEVSVDVGSVTLSTTVGNMTLSATAGSVSMSSGLAMSLTSSTTMSLSASAAINITAPQVLVGGAAATMGVVRGLPGLPIGSPSLDPITGAPLIGSATFRSNL